MTNMMNPVSIITACQNYRVARYTGSELLSCDSETWFVSTVVVIDDVCRDKVMSTILNPMQIGIIDILKKK